MAPPPVCMKFFFCAILHIFPEKEGGRTFFLKKQSVILRKVLSEKTFKEGEIGLKI